MPTFPSYTEDTATTSKTDSENVNSSTDPHEHDSKRLSLFAQQQQQTSQASAADIPPLGLFPVAAIAHRSVIFKKTNRYRRDEYNVNNNEEHAVPITTDSEPFNAPLCFLFPPMLPPLFRIGCCLRLISLETLLSEALRKKKVQALDAVALAYVRAFFVSELVSTSSSSSSSRFLVMLLTDGLRFLTGF